MVRHCGVGLEAYRKLMVKVAFVSGGLECWSVAACSRSSIQILAEHPEAESFPKASFDVLDLCHVPVGQNDVYIACCFKVAEVGPVAGEGDRIRRQIRVVGTEEGETESCLAFDYCSHGFCDRRALVLCEREVC